MLSLAAGQAAQEADADRGCGLDDERVKPMLAALQVSNFSAFQFQNLNFKVQRSTFNFSTSNHQTFRPCASGTGRH